MSGRGRLALSAYLATVLTSGALLSLVTPWTWLFEAALLLALVCAAGAVCRRIPLARSLTVLVQAVVALLLLTVAFARDAAPLGFVPTPAVFLEFGRLLRQGGQDVTQYAVPAPTTPGIGLMLIGGVVLVGLAVDAAAVTFRRAAPAGLPLLALYSVAAGISGDSGRFGGWEWFLLAAVGYLLLLLAESGERLSQWGRVFGGPRRPGDGTPGAGRVLAPARTGRRIGAVSLGVALLAAGTLPVMGGGLLPGVGTGTGTGIGGGTISAVNPLVSLQDDLNDTDDRVALRYKTNSPDAQDMYLRIMALDEFDGTTWRFSRRSVENVPDRLPEPQGLSATVGTTTITTNITAADWYQQDYLPMPYPATKVDADGRWRFEPAGRTLVGDRGQTTGGASYSVSSLEVTPTAAQLAAAPPPPASIKREYTKVPADLPAVVKSTAQRVTAGASDDYEKAVKLQNWFSLSGGFTYNTHVDSGTGPQAIARFLKEKQGFCVHFAFSMAAMARTLGIPARVAVGFTPGRPLGDGSMSVGLKDAHAWPELYFQGVGWTRFEPTPSRGSVPPYTLPNETTDPITGGHRVPDVTPSDEASAAPSTSSSCAVQDRRMGDCAGAAQGTTQPPSSSSGGLSARDVLWTVIGGVVLLIVLAPLLWRMRVRSRRLAAPYPGAGAHLRPRAREARGQRGRLQVAVDDAGYAEQGALEPDGPVPRMLTDRALAAWQETVDTGWDLGIVPDDSLTPRRAAERLSDEGHLDGPTAEAVHRLADAVEQALYAQAPRPAAGLADDVRRVRAGLRASASRRARLRAALAPRSAVRLLWAASESWEAFRARWSPRRLVPAGGWTERTLRRRR